MTDLIEIPNGDLGQMPPMFFKDAIEWVDHPRELRALDRRSKVERYDFEATVTAVPPEIYSNEERPIHGNCHRIALQRTEKCGAVFLRKRLALNRLTFGAKPGQVDAVLAKRDYAMLVLLLGCGLRRSELVHLTVEHLQQREEHWVIVDLVGKGGHVRTVPVPGWVKAAVEIWTTTANIKTGRLFRCVNKSGSIWAEASPKRSSGA